MSPLDNRVHDGRSARIARPAKRGPGLRVTIGLVGLIQTVAIVAAIGWFR